MRCGDCEYFEVGCYCRLGEFGVDADDRCEIDDLDDEDETRREEV